MKDKAEELNQNLKGKSPQEVLSFFMVDLKGVVKLGSSLGAEDQVLTDMMTKIDPKPNIFTLDTGRLFPETYETLDATNKKYDINIELYFPDAVQVQNMVKEKGINLFYESIENRKMCCHIRKIEPLKRALKGVDVWVSGLRKDQSVTRFFTPLIEWDETYNLLKVNPLLSWSERDVWAYIHEHDIPYNSLHDKGFPSIGCQPCTRAVKPGEDVRAGRWWWEEPEQKECGLHVKEKQAK